MGKHMIHSSVALRQHTQAVHRLSRRRIPVQDSLRRPADALYILKTSSCQFLHLLLTALDQYPVSIHIPSEHDMFRISYEIAQKLLSFPCEVFRFESASRPLIPLHQAKHQQIIAGRINLQRQPGRLFIDVLHGYPSLKHLHEKVGTGELLVLSGLILKLLLIPSLFLL